MVVAVMREKTNNTESVKRNLPRYATGTCAVPLHKTLLMGCSK